MEVASALGCDLRRMIEESERCARGRYDGVAPPGRRCRSNATLPIWDQRHDRATFGRLEAASPIVPCPIRTFVPLGHVAAHLPMIEVLCQRGDLAAVSAPPDHRPGSGNECQSNTTLVTTTSSRRGSDSMFFRTHRIGRNVYTEALESYRDDSGKPRHRCVARWHADQSFAVALGKARHAVEDAADTLAYWQGVIDRTVRPTSLPCLAPGLAGSGLMRRCQPRQRRVSRATGTRGARYRSELVIVVNVDPSPHLPFDVCEMKLLSLAHPVPASISIRRRSPPPWVNWRPNGTPPDLGFTCLKEWAFRDFIPDNILGFNSYPTPQRISH